MDEKDVVVEKVVVETTTDKTVKPIKPTVDFFTEGELDYQK